jgi:hypothetical protein
MPEMFSNNQEYLEFLDMRCCKCKHYDEDVWDDSIPQKEWERRFCPVLQKLIQASGFGDPEDFPSKEVHEDENHAWICERFEEAKDDA